MPKASSKTGAPFWSFPSTNHGEEDGFNDSILEYFQGDHENYIAREAIQNAVDARLDYKEPVRVVFERLYFPMAELPGHKTLEEKMPRCSEFVSGQTKAETFFEAATDLLKSSKLPVLKISDFNTVGLSGSDDDRAGNWYRLVRATGTSSPKGVAGGSFGIGKGAPIAASSLRTVFYSSINDKGEAVFQGKARLVSHYEKRDVRQGVGFFGVDGYKAIRDLDSIPSLFRRDERGTDIFVMGYEPEGDWQAKLVKSVLHNFWLTILHGDLEVAIRDDKKGELAITRETLRAMLDEFDAEDAKFFYEAATNPSQEFVTELKHLGKVVLYVRKQDGYPSRIMMARKPKMLVQDRPFRVLREPFAGVLLCADDRGNDLLRDLEPPAHDKWDKNRAKNGWAALKELDEFIKQSLKSMGETAASEPQDIPGLDRYLPDNEDRDYMPQGGAPMEATEQESQEESGREVGATKEPAPSDISTVVRKGVVTQKQPGKVKVNPPDGRKDGKTGRGTGQEDGGVAGIRVRTSSISFRSFAQKAKDGIEYKLVITGREDCEGAISLAAVGDDGNYPIDVQSATDADTKKSYEVGGALIKGLVLKSGQTVRISVRLSSKKKYAIGIENYEG